MRPSVSQSVCLLYVAVTGATASVPIAHATTTGLQRKGRGVTHAADTHTHTTNHHHMIKGGGFDQEESLLREEKVTATAMQELVRLKKAPSDFEK